MSKKKTVLNESQVRRWGKLAAIRKPLTENWLDTITEEDGEEEMEMDAEEAPAEEAPAEEAPAEEAPAGDMEDTVEDIVAAVVDAISDVTDVDISMDAGEEAAAEEPAGEEEMEMDAEEEPGMRDPAMRDPAMRDDDEEPGMRDKRPMEGLDLEVIDDEELTEAVLQRVVERLLKRK